MNQTIKYRGLALTPDEINAPAGTLAMSANAELHDGALRPSVLIGTEIQNDLKVGNKTVKLIFVHKTTSYHHFIAINETNYKIYSFDKDGSQISNNEIFSANSTDVKVESIGNTIIILDSDGLHYILWKDSTYSYIGQQPPFVRLSFGLDGDYPAKYDRSTVQHNPIEEQYYSAWRSTGIDTEDALVANTKINFKNDNGQHTRITEAVWALINQAHNLIASEGHFYAPFVVRYCYRLYDGSSILHSAPVFMPTSMPHPFKVYFENAVSTGNSESPILVINEQINVHEGSDEFTISAVTARYQPRNTVLSYRLEYDNSYQILQEKWKDIVKSIDVFVSPQFIRADESKIIETASEEKTTPSECDYGLYGAIPNGNYLNKIISTRTIQSDGVTYTPNIIFDIPEISEEAYLDRIQNNSAFFKVCSFNLDEQLDTHFVPVPIDKSAIAAITAQEQMTDDYKTHNLLLPSFDENNKMVSKIYSYNHRLNAFGLREQLFEGFNFEGMMIPILRSYDYNFGKIYVNSVYVEIETESGTKIVRKIHSGHEVNVWALCHSLLFYPDSRATKITINYTDNNGNKYINLPMKACPELNGAMATSLWEKNSLSGATSGTYNPTESKLVDIQNKLYTSDLNNPFYFPPNGINTVGTGAILGIAANTRALTQGQFGKFPLLVFTTDGIWAMDVSATGTYSAIHPISREVCSNPDSICQIDQQVVFATNRGLSVVTEQNVTSFSDELDGIFPALGTIAPGIDRYVEQGDSLETLFAFNISPVDFFQTAKVIYDFANSRLLFIRESPLNSQGDGNTGAQGIFVYSLRDKTWSTMTADIIYSAVNAYPNPYLQATDGVVTCLDKRYPFNNAQITAISTLIVTRALAFGDAMYAINDFAHNKMAEAKTVMFIFGSNDAKTWHHVGRTNQDHGYYLPANSFRYFRLALFNRMKPNERYISTSLNVYEKFPKL